MTASPAPTTTDTAVSYALDNGIATLTLDRPGRYNTLTSEVIAAMSTQLAAIAASSEVRVVIIAATGKAFSTGHDLKEMNAHRDEAFYRRLLADCSRMMQAIVALPQPVIARVQGIATAAGCQLVASCDLAVAARSARFATNGIANGLYCATPSVALSRVVQRKHALEMLLTGDFIDAARAAEIGLVNHVVDDAALDQHHPRHGAAHRRQIAVRSAPRQGLVLSSGQSGSRQRLSRHLGRTGVQSARRRWRRGPQRLHRKASAEVAGPLKPQH